jgi:hypothetical protein
MLKIMRERVFGPAAMSGLVQERDLRIDFFRGIAQILVFFDHTNGSSLLLRFFAFFDASEVFICISGYISYLVYNRILSYQGTKLTILKIYRRIGKLYLDNFLTLIAYIGYVALADPNPILNYSSSDKFLSEIIPNAIGTLTLFPKIPYQGVLPVYMSFLALLPVILYGFRKNLLATVLISFTVYFLELTTLWGTNTWIAPLSGQFLFVIGAAICHLQLNGRRIIVPTFIPLKDKTITIVNRWNWLTLSAVIIVITCFLLNLKAVNSLIFPEGLPWRLFQSKELLSPMRLLNFLAVVVVINHFVHRSSAFLGWAVSRTIALLGQHSLVVFCTGMLMSLIFRPIYLLETTSLNAKVAMIICGLTAMVAAASLRRLSQRYSLSRALYKLRASIAHSKLLTREVLWKLRW